MKKQNFLKTLLITLSFILLGAGELKAYDFSAENNDGKTIYYSYVNKESGVDVKVTYETTSSYNSYSGSIEIPSTVTNESNGRTYNVTQIGAYAFKACSGLTSVSLPSSITFIDNNAFYECNNDSFTSISIPSGVTAIPYNCFYGCTKLTTVTIPSSVISIGMSAFRDCTNLSSINDISNVNDLGSNAFYNCSSLTSMTIPSSVTTIPSSCFYGCSGLTSVTIPSGITTIKTYAFQNCNNAKLTSIALPSTVSTIEGSAFKGCTGLTSVTIPSVITLGNNAFQGCTRLTSVTIPSSVTTLGSNAFQDCTGLTEINYNATSLGNFTNSTKPFKGCNINNITLTIGENVTSIPAYAFSGTKTSGALIIPSSVTTIGTRAFENNLGKDYTSLATIYMLRTDPPTIADANIFKTSSDYCDIKVLTGSLTAYQEAPNWSTFRSNISETDNFTIANMDLTNGSLTIPAGNTITVTGTLTNTDASHLVIADGGQLICNNSVNATLQKEITKAEVWGEPGADAWYFIASPVDGYATSNVIINGTNGTDLYSFDEESGYWFNAQGTAHPFTTLNRGQGYLYANRTGEALAFAGEMPATNSNIEKTLSYAGSGSAQGFNLMGNPFTCNLTKDNVKFFNGTENTNITSYYTVENGVDLTLVNDFSENPIKPGRGFLIQATAAGQKLVFNPGAKRGETTNKPSFIVIEAGNDSFMDRACVQIGSGNTLRKMTINDNVSHVYVMQDDKDYAAATIEEALGEMPVCFKAAQDGQYTITVNPQEVEMGYLHLIDNVAGKDIDLLLTPSYTFNAKADDYESRFRLVFSANMVNTDLNDDFAFFSNGQLVIANEGESLLQVIDVNGRIVMTESVNGTCSKAINVKAGVYVLRLIQGTDVKTQKIIVK